RGDGSNNPGNNLHVSSLSHKVDTRDLEAAFAKVGRIKKAQVMYDPHTRESRGFGFVTMETPEEADAAITALNGTDLMGKNMTVEKVRMCAFQSFSCLILHCRPAELALGLRLPAGTTDLRSATNVRFQSFQQRKRKLISFFAVERPYDPRPYDSRYSRLDERRPRGRYDDDYRGGGGMGRDYDRGYGRDYDRGYGRDYDRRGGGGGGGYEGDRRY
ncbi:RNA-binding domain-containing protein, partial [Laetiporus sulphureus 93-53]